MNYIGKGESNPFVHNNMKFSTFDCDNDPVTWSSCSKCTGGRGGWWFNGCFGANLNGLNYDKNENKAGGIVWYLFNTDDFTSLKTVTMSIRPNNV